MYKVLCLVLVIVLTLMPSLEAYAFGEFFFASVCASGNVGAVGIAAACVVAGAIVKAIEDTYHPIEKLLVWGQGQLQTHAFKWFGSQSGSVQADLNRAGTEYMASGSMTLSRETQVALESLIPYALPVKVPETFVLNEGNQPELKWTYNSVDEIIDCALVKVVYAGSPSVFYAVPYRWGLKDVHLFLNYYEVRGTAFRKASNQIIDLFWNYASVSGSESLVETAATDFDNESLVLPRVVVYLRGNNNFSAKASHYSCETAIEHYYALLYEWAMGTAGYSVEKLYEDETYSGYEVTIGDTITSSVPVVANPDGYTYAVTMDYPTDVYTGVESIPTTTGDIGEITGTVGSILSLLQGLAGSIASAIQAVFVGDWSTVDFGTLEGVFENVSTRFPFSIPWDLARIVNIFDVPAVSAFPEVALAMPGGIWGTDTVVLALPSGFDSFFNWIRWILLAVWDIGLISWITSWFGAGDK